MSLLEDLDGAGDHRMMAFAANSGKSKNRARVNANPHRPSTRSIRVTGIPGRRHVTDSALMDLFLPHGPVTGFERRRDTRGVEADSTQVVVSFETEEAAWAALQEVEGLEIAKGATLAAFPSFEREKLERDAEMRREKALRVKEREADALADYLRKRRARKYIDDEENNDTDDDEANSPVNSLPETPPNTPPETESLTQNNSNNDSASDITRSGSALAEYLNKLREAEEVRSTFVEAFGAGMSLHEVFQDRASSLQADGVLGIGRRPRLSIFDNRRQQECSFVTNGPRRFPHSRLQLQ